MYQKIIVPLDGSELAECVLPHVDNIVKHCGTKTVIFLRVVEPFYVTEAVPIANTEYASAMDINRLEAENVFHAENYQEQLLTRVQFDGVEVKAEVIKGHPAERISDYANDHKADLIIIATHGRSGISRWVFGSVADRVLRSSCVPVLMIRAPSCIPGI